MVGGKLKYLIFIVVLSLAQAFFVATITDGANFREGPGVDRSIRWDLDMNYPLNVINSQGEWYQVVDYAGYQGWINKTVVAKKNVVIVKKTKINLRGGPGLNYRVLSQAYKGQTFFVLSESGLWYRVKDTVTGKIAWIYKPLVWGYK
jgi:SH3-like domain-containing protein